MLASIEKRDADSLLDIAQTLRLEPRHFGAIAGFGNICLRHGHLNEARAAFQIALFVNPHMDDLRDMLENLSPHHHMLHARPARSRSAALCLGEDSNLSPSWPALSRP
ncbi:MAG: hypothetical protein ACJ8B9_04565, partial [Microvirga sp.]